MTFDPHPSLVLGGRKEKVFYITPLEQKIEILKELQVDAVFVVRFTSDFAKLTPRQFVEFFIKQVNVKHVTAGFDFTFGAFGKGTMEDMEQLSEGRYTVIGSRKTSRLIGEKISSTRIREALKEGDMEQVQSITW